MTFSLTADEQENLKIWKSTIQTVLDEEKLDGTFSFTFKITQNKQIVEVRYEHPIYGYVFYKNLTHPFVLGATCQYD